MEIYKRIKDLREDKDLKQSEVAEVLKTTQSYYVQYESGKRQIPFDRMVEIAEFYNVSLDYIAGRTNDKKGLTRSELSAEETELIKKFRSLSEMRKGKLSERLEMLYEDEREETALRKEAK